MQISIKQTGVAAASMVLSALAFAQSCTLPPGTVGIGKYCPDATVGNLAGETTSRGAIQLAAQPPVKNIPAIALTQNTSESAKPNSPAAQGTATALPMATSAASTPQVLVQPAQTKTWTIQPTDGRLAVTLERWAKQDGMRLVWDAQQHVLLSSSDTFKGTLQEALNRVLTSPAIRLSAYPLEACIYPNEPPVLRITRAGEQDKDCAQ